MDNKINTISIEQWDATKSFSSYYGCKGIWVIYNNKYYKPKPFNTEAHYGAGIIPSESPEFWEEVDLSEQ